MFGVGWSELALVGAVALIAIGPKDLPKVMYALGRWTRKARAFMQEMNRMLDQATYEADIAERLEKEAKPKSYPNESEPSSTIGTNPPK